MLSRIAESLFWIGRYVERADGTARIVDVMRLQLLEEYGATEEQSARLALSVIMGLPVDGEARFSDIRRLLVTDSTQPSSIAGSWFAARENARRARETISTELWEGINTAWHRWRSLAGGEVSAHQLAWVRERAALLTGIADSTMSHDEARDFLVLGRSLERADMTARLVAAGALPYGGARWATVLQGCGAQQAYLRSSNGLASDDDAATFLVLDRQFPRSVLFALAQAEQALAALSPDTERLGMSDEARRLLGRARTRLEYETPGVLRADLSRQMLGVQEAISAASDAIADRYFATVPALEWHKERL